MNTHENTFIIFWLFYHDTSFHLLLKVVLFFITQIVDRPSIGHKFLSREYVQPQWIYDCINVRLILPTDQYLLGRYVIIILLK